MLLFRTKYTLYSIFLLLLNSHGQTYEKNVFQLYLIIYIKYVDQIQIQASLKSKYKYQNSNTNKYMTPSLTVSYNIIKIGISSNMIAEIIVM